MKSHPHTLIVQEVPKKENFFWPYNNSVIYENEKTIVSMENYLSYVTTNVFKGNVVAFHTKDKIANMRCIHIPIFFNKA